MEVHRGEEILSDRAVDKPTDGCEAGAGEDDVGPAAGGAVGTVPALGFVGVCVCVRVSLRECVCVRVEVGRRWWRRRRG